MTRIHYADKMGKLYTKVSCAHNDGIAGEGDLNAQSYAHHTDHNEKSSHKIYKS